MIVIPIVVIFFFYVSLKILCIHVCAEQTAFQPSTFPLTPARVTLNFNATLNSISETAFGRTGGTKNSDAASWKRQAYRAESPNERHEKYRFNLSKELIYGAGGKQRVLLVAGRSEAI